ncbi:MAG: tRNA pseudouridine13 synthase [Gammaproteobacteria bacterium]|jgi:tRNA pseudouridine13 synthase
MIEQITLSSALTPPTVGTGNRPVGTIKTAPDHFQVVEIPSVLPSGDGSHRWLELERVGMNTEFAARQIARIAGVAKRDVGYAGLKDRHARTRQWFSVPGFEDAEALVEPLAECGLQVHTSARHERKLRRGALRGNRFKILVLAGDNQQCFEADGEAGDVALNEAVCASVEVLRVRGAANYFGPQRFGHHGNNLHHAQRMLLDGKRVRERHLRGLYLSAARSALFNQVLSARVRDGSWDSLLPGEAVMLDGSASWFLTDAVDDQLTERLAAFDVHPSGPLVGDGDSPATAVAAQIESAALADCEAWLDALRATRMEPARRALRVSLVDLQIRQAPGEGWWLEFSLPAGAYATMMLREIFDVVDASQNRHESVC